MSDRLQTRFVDLDQCFRQREGDISNYFQRYGYQAYARQNVEVFLRDRPDLQPLLARLDSVRGQLAKRAFDLPSPAHRDAWLRQLDQLRNDKEQLEADLTRAAKNFPALRPSPPSLRQVSKALPANAVLIDFLAYSSGIPLKERTGKGELKSHLLAFILGPDHDVVELIDLGPPAGEVRANLIRTFELLVLESGHRDNLRGAAP